MDFNIFSRLLLLVLLTITVTLENVICLSICERTPIHTTALQKPGDNGFSIRILDLPKNGKYVPGETYTGRPISKILVKFNLIQLSLSPDDRQMMYWYK